MYDIILRDGTQYFYQPIINFAAKLRIIATAVFKPAEIKATLFPTSFQMIAKVERQGIKKLTNTVKIIICSLETTVSKLL